MSRYVVAAITVLAFAGFANRADATVVFSGNSGGLSASASFTISGNQLTILLTNTDAATGAGMPTDPASVLSGLFFNLGTSTFTPISASVHTGEPNGVIQQGSIIQATNPNNGTANCDAQACAGQTNIGGEWSYASGRASWLSGTTQGISSSGYLNNNANSGNFNGPNYQNPSALNGIEFGLVPNAWLAGSGNGGLDKNALIEGTVMFVLEGVAGKSESDIRSVYFTYGTSAGENTVPGTTSTIGDTLTTGAVPEPALLSMLGMALAGAAYRMRKPGSSA
jgi:hypothetical protein